MKKIVLTIYILLIISTLGFGQKLTGIVVNQDKEPLVGATLQWQGTAFGTLSNAEGYFAIERIPSTDILVVSYVGYESDTIQILPEEDGILVFFAMGVEMGEITITAKDRTNFASTLKTYNMETITSGELRKAACCNLSESFETNGSVNVAYSDAVTGAKEIEMLGLRGVYTQMQLENRPMMRGLAYPFGMEYIPGTWVDKILVAKGASTVVNGYEGIAGNINIELIKPFEGEKLFINTYANHLGRTELNIHANHNINEKWSIGTLLHGNYNQYEVDHNDDDFLDMPKKKMLNGMIRTFYRGEKLRGQFNIQALRQEIDGGQVGFEENPADLYGFNLTTDRVEAFAKLGYIGFENQFASLGWITNATWHKNDGFFGNNQYDATQQSLYTNLIYQNILGSTNHNYKLGASYIYDNYDEVFAGEDYSLMESVPGVFAEYDFSKSKKVSKTVKHEEHGEHEEEHEHTIEKERTFGLIVGLRTDYHNQFGLFVTPRLSMKYNFDESTVIRFNAGRGYRTARILAENISALTSARTINVLEDLEAEEAWNIGVNFTKNFTAFGKEMVSSTDFYSTHFTNQIVMDRETAADEIQFYNLDGQSFSNSFLTTLGVNLTEYLELKFAYKYNDVKVTYNGDLLQVPLVAKHRGLVTASLTSNDDTWKFHTTLQVVGPQRLPDLSTNSELLTAYQLAGESPTFATLNAQLTKTFGNWEFYIGGENLTNYMQENPIIGATDPFNNDAGIPVFDASQIFAPIMGTVGYAGFRFTLR